MPKLPRTPSIDTDVTRCTIQQLTRLPAEVLRLHFSSCHLLVTGTKVIMAHRLYDALHQLPSSHATVQPTTTVTATQSTSATTTTLMSQPVSTPPLPAQPTTTPMSQPMSSSPLPAQPTPPLYSSATMSNLPPTMQAQLSSLMI